MSTVLRPPQRQSDPEAPAPEPPRRLPVVTWAETAECTCPDDCERDHELD
jgi:hypothetical protein